MDDINILFDGLEDNETARYIKGHEGKYAVTDYGRVYSFKTNKFLSQAKHGRNRKYRAVLLYENHKPVCHPVHRLVAEAFIPNPNNLPIVNHKDENPSNNHVSNLEWCTNEYNLNYGHCGDKISKNVSRPIRCIELDKVFLNSVIASKELKIDKSAISKAARGERHTAGGYHWEYINDYKKMLAEQRKKKHQRV